MLSYILSFLVLLAQTLLNLKYTSEIKHNCTKTDRNQPKTINCRQKATGTDNLPPGLLKDCAVLISKPLSHIINLSLRTGSFPAGWKSEKVTPVYKSGNTSLPENYRPISVLPIMSKILAKAVHHGLKDFLENENLLTKCQHGFRKKHSTKTASILFSDTIRKEMDNGKLYGCSIR